MIPQIKSSLSNVTDYPLRRHPHFILIFPVESAQLMKTVLCYVFRNKIRIDVTSQDPQHLNFGGNLHLRESQSLSINLRLLRYHHTTHQVNFTLLIKYSSYSVTESNFLFAMGSLDHANTELLNFSTWQWKNSVMYYNYTEIYSFAAFFYRFEFYVVGGRTKNEVLSAVSTFSPITEKWTQIGSLKFPRFDLTIETIDDKLYIIGGSETFEYCDLSNDFGCAVFTDAKFKQEDYPRLYGLYPSKCEPGNF